MMQSVAAEVIDDWSPGIQAYASSPVGKVDFASGSANETEMQLSTCIPLWCASKPVLVQVALAIAEARGLSPEDDITVLLPPSLRRPVRSIPLDSVFAHRAGLSALRMYQVLCTNVAGRRMLAEDSWAAAAAPQDQAFADYTPFVIAEAIVEQSYSAPAGEVLDGLLAAVGIEELRFSNFECLPLGWWWGRSRGRWIPMLGHAIPGELMKLTPALGGVGSARGLGAWYESLLQQFGGSSCGSSLFPSGGYLESMLASSSEEFDSNLKRVCGFSAGFAYPMSGHGVAQSGRSLGHSGWMGRVLCMADIDDGVAVSLVLNGVEFDCPEAIEGIRERALGCLKADLLAVS